MLSKEWTAVDPPTAVHALPSFNFCLRRFAYVATERFQHDVEYTQQEFFESLCNSCCFVGGKARESLRNHSPLKQGTLRQNF